jgi:hypothetical protein
MNLTPEAQSALSRMGTSKVGASILKGGAVKADVLVELKERQVITATGNLTMRGSIARERIVDAALDAAFAL